MTLDIAHALKWACEVLPGESFESRLDAEYLLSFVLKVSRTDFYIKPDFILTEKQLRIFESFILRRCTGEPVAYIIERQPFMDLELKVSTETLIPRSETELLVEAILAQNSFDSKLTVCDLGTGSGAIACSLAHARKNWQVLATDASEGALEVARYNAVINQLSVEFIKSDWFSDIINKRFDIIACNPPYVDYLSSEVEDSVRYFEPHLALFADDKGMGDLEVIINKSPSYLNIGGCIYLEHGYDQQEDVVLKLTEIGFDYIKKYEDLSGRPRFVSAIWNGGGKI